MRFAMMLIAAVITAGSAASAQQHVTATRSVYVHRGPSKSSPELGVMEQGDTAIFLSHRSGYDRVQLTDSTVGWVYGRYVAIDSGAAAQPSGGVSQGNMTGDIASLPKPAPQEEHAAACADIGLPNRPGTPVDTGTNVLKNRIDDGQYHDVSFDAVLRLPWQGLARRRYQWTAEQRQQVATNEGAAVSMVGYLVAVKPEGPEQTNCELPDPTWHDWHMWIVETPAEATPSGRVKAVVVEVTPRLRQLDPARFDLHQIQQWVTSHQHVRVSGWLLLDPDHPDQVGKTRGTTWEIHPVMKIEAVP